MTGAALHGESARRQRFLNEGFDLRTQAGLAVGEESESFDGSTSHHIGWVVVERDEQPDGAQAMSAGLRDAGNDQTKVGARSPVVACTFAEEAQQAFGVWGEELRLLLSDTANGVGGAMAQPGIDGKESTQQGLEQLGMGEDLHGVVLRVRETPSRSVEFQQDFSC